MTTPQEKLTKTRHSFKEIALIVTHLRKEIVILLDDLDVLFLEAERDNEAKKKVHICNRCGYHIRCCDDNA